MGQGRVHHIGITVRDVNRSERQFYGLVLGFLGYERVDDGDRVSFWRDRKGGPTLHLVQGGLRMDLTKAVA